VCGIPGGAQRSGAESATIWRRLRFQTFGRQRSEAGHPERITARHPESPPFQNSQGNNFAKIRGFKVTDYIWNTTELKKKFGSSQDVLDEMRPTR